MSDRLENEALSPKRRRIDATDVILDDFNNKFRHGHKFKEAYKRVASKSAVTLSEIKACNAGIDCGISFSNSTCETKQHIQEVFPFGSLFCPALEILNKYFIDGDDGLPQDTESRVVLSKLMLFMMDENVVKYLKRVSNEQEVKSKSVVASILTRHYLAKLTTSGFTVDQRYSNSQCCYSGGSSCICDVCTDINNTKFGDTSIGNYSTWHGSLDVIFDKAETFVHVIEEPDLASPGDKVLDEEEESGMKELQSRSQIFSQTIVHSFLQKKRHPDKTHSLVAGIAISRNEIQFVFYDCDNDYLLESFKMKLLNFDDTLNYDAVIATWLVLNYKSFCSGITSRVALGPKSNFHSFAGDCLDLYKYGLQFKNAYKGKEPQFLDQTDVNRLDTIFMWPSDLDKYKTDKV